MCTLRNHIGRLRVLKLSVVILACFAVAPRISAQRSLTLEECLGIARANSIGLRLEEHAARAAELSASELGTTGLPQVKAVGAASYAPESRSFGYDPAISNGGQLAGQAVIQQSVYDGGVRALKSDQIQLEIERLTHERRAVDRDLVYTVSAFFVDALRASEEAAIQAASVRQLTEYLELVRQMMRGGNAGQTDVLKTEVQLDNARIALEKASEEGVLAKASLAESMGIPGDTTFVPSGVLEDPEAAAEPTVSVDSAATIDLRMAGLEAQKAVLDVEMAQRERLPAVSFSGDAGVLSSLDNLRLPPGERVTGLGYSIGVLVELPLFTWGSIGLRVEQRQLAAESQRLRLEQLKRTLRTEVNGVRAQMQTARSALRTLKGTLRSAEDAYLLTKSKFAGGGTLSIEVLSAQQLLADTRTARLHSLAEWHTLKARLAQLTAQ